MTNTTIDSDDEVKRYIARRSKPLAELRAKNAWEICELKDVLNDTMKHGCAIGISPRDDVLNKFSRGEITHIIKSIFKRMRIRSLVASKMSLTADAHPPLSHPITLALVGEYSESHRWHYHGIILIDNIVLLSNLKKRISKFVGRTVSETIRNVPNYIDYMFKQYECDEHGSFYDWDRKECYLEVIKEVK